METLKMSERLEQRDWESQRQSGWKQSDETASHVEGEKLSLQKLIA